MIKSINFIIPLVIYPFKVIVSMRETDEQLRKKISKYDLSEADIESCSYDNDMQTGRCVMTTTNIILIRTKYIPKANHEYAVLQHEIFHAVQFITDYLIMVPLSMNNCEAYAYLIQYLTQEIYNKIK